MAPRRRRDGQETAPDMQQRANDCPGFVASDEDSSVCVRCQAHQELHPPKGDDDGVEDLEALLPPSDTAEAVAERQAEAAADAGAVTAPPPDDEGANRLAMANGIREARDELDAIAAQKRALDEKAEKVRERVRDEFKVDLGAFSEVRKLEKLAPATIVKREANRRLLIDVLIKPKLDEAEAGRADE